LALKAVGLSVSNKWVANVYQNFNVSGKYFSTSSS